MKQFLPLFFLFFALAAQSQHSHELVVGAPSSAAGKYPVLIGTFGNYACSLSGTLSAVQDAQGQALGCGSISTDLTGKIAFIDRGTCSFSEKVLNAQLKGAIAVLVANNVSGSALVSMGSTQPFAAKVTIPSFFISQGDGAKLKAALAEGLQIQIGTIPLSSVDTVSRDVVWGKLPGEGDFAGGLNGWKVANIWCGDGRSVPTGNLWSWNASGATPPSSCGRGVLASPTSCNGAMVFASNFLDDSGAECGAALGSGSCPAGQLGELISPLIRLRGKGTSGYQLGFYQSSRQLNSDYAILWSVNGGSSWDTTVINQDLAANASLSAPFMLVPLANTANADSLIVKFRFSGNYYFWIIDDVKIFAQEQNNLRVNNFYAIPPNYATPLSQVESLGFLADVENSGSIAQANVRLSVSVKNDAGQQVFSTERVLGTIPANTLVENQVLNAGFTPTKKGGYTGQYEVASDVPDFDTRDNLRSFQFVVSDSTFAKENGQNLRAISPSATNWQNGEAHSAAYGNVFFVPKGKGFFSRSVQFGLANAAELKDRALIVTLYKWNDLNQDGLSQSTERTAVAFNFYEVKGTESSPLSLINLALPAETDEPVALEDNTTYLVMLEYYAPQADGVDLDALASYQFDYRAQVTLGLGTNKPRFTTMTGLAADLTQETYSPLGYSAFPGEYSYVLRWNISNDQTTPTRALSLIDDQVAVFPNPASDLLHVQFGLREPAAEVAAELLDVSGKRLAQYFWSQVQKGVYSIPVADIPAGVYYLQLRSDRGTASRKVLIAR